ncbi:hypothetical protein L2E82_31336 [Cichorium intybus]|uniref:Uncharacterized protein n=1 Tax=Cichorium intybus TaxID=13427 RepID=A0ACB9D3K0_CICIN|nr:hypothetical protein L2E82_31336 [Cichorium intybus]
MSLHVLNNVTIMNNQNTKIDESYTQKIRILGDSQLWPWRAATNSVLIGTRVTFSLELSHRTRFLPVEGSPSLPYKLTPKSIPNSSQLRFEPIFSQQTSSIFSKCRSSLRLSPERRSLSKSRAPTPLTTSRPKSKTRKGFPQTSKG